MNNQSDEVLEYIDDAPNLPILDMILKTKSVIAKHRKIMVAISGGSDSDILVDLFCRLDPKRKVQYVFYNTGLEYEATKRHIEELKEKYEIEVETCKNVSDMHPVDEFICSSCGVIIRDCSRYEIDEDGMGEACLEFIYRYCPRCGKRIVYEGDPDNG